MGAIGSFFRASKDDEYHQIEDPTFDNIQLGSRNFDCVMIFDHGEDVDWKPPADGAAIQFEYLKLLKTEDIDERKTKFPQHGADFAQKRPSQRDFYKFERRLMIKALMHLRIKVARITEMGKEFEKQHNQSFYYVGVNEPIVRRFAHGIQYGLELDPQAAIMYFNLQDETLARSTLSSEENAQAIRRSFWSNIFVRFDMGVAPEIYKSYDVLDENDQEMGYEDSLFTIRDRLMLINEMVTQDIEVGGAGIYVPFLAAKDHCMRDFFPLHTVEQLDDMMKDLFDWQHLTYNCLTLPLDKLRQYFGEYIAIYFAYLQYFTWFLMPAAILGSIVNIIQIGTGEILLGDGVIAVFAMIIILWSIMFPLIWRNLEYWYAMKWGTLKFDDDERPRPEFNGLYMKSTIDGKMFEYFPPHLRAQRRLLSLGVVAAFLLAMGASVAGVILLRIWVVDSDVSLGDYYVSAANSFTIMFFNNIYGVFAEEMNSWENYQTESEYEDQLIIKVFVFRFINSYATLYYYAFVRPFESGSLYCDAESCMETLRTQLAVIFLTQLTVSNCVELGSLFAKNVAKGGVPVFGSADTKKRVWTEFTSQTYERTFDDYCELMISFGYCSLFVISFPFALLAAFIGGIIEARIDGYKLCRLTRRPFPRQADDIGSWQFSMEFMAYAVLFTNLALVCFVTDDLEFGFLDLSSEEFEEAITALIIFLILSLVIRIANHFVSVKPQRIVMHEQRQAHVEKQLVAIGERIERYLDALDNAEIEAWEKWSTKQVCKYLREVLFKNNDEFKHYQKILMKNKFNGDKFADAEEHDFQEMGITDYFVVRFLLNARRILDAHLRQLRKETNLLDDIDEMQAARRQKRSQTNADQKVFMFTMDHIPAMADFFEEDFAGQSKKKLWERVDQDRSGLIEKSELTTFLYYTIVVFVKSTHEDVRMPKTDDPTIKRKIIDPLKAWLLHYKMTTALTYDDFDRFFSTWLREFVRERELAGVVSGEEADADAEP